MTDNEVSLETEKEAQNGSVRALLLQRDERNVIHEKNPGIIKILIIRVKSASVTNSKAKEKTLTPEKTFL